MSQRHPRGNMPVVADCIWDQDDVNLSEQIADRVLSIDEK